MQIFAGCATGPTMVPWLGHQISDLQFHAFGLWLQMQGPDGVQEAIKLTMQPANGVRMLCCPRDTSFGDMT